MRLRDHIILIFAAILVPALALSQTSSVYQRAIINEVAPHQAAGNEQDPTMEQYEVTVTVGGTKYTVLHTVPKSRDLLKLAPGMDLPVLVQEDALVFTSKGFGMTTEDPILRREVLNRKSGIDWSKTPGEYFSMQSQYFADALGLTADQRAKLRPVMEQETGEVAQINLNPVLSHKDKLKRYQEIVGSSDRKMSLFLSADQISKLASVRAQQNEELEDLARTRLPNRRTD